MDSVSKMKRCNVKLKNNIVVVDAEEHSFPTYLGMDYSVKRKFLTLPGLELQSLCRPARSQSLYRLRYPGSYNEVLIKEKQTDNSFMCQLTTLSM
jgi:hypothetical protein